MVINLNVPVKLFQALTDAIVQLTSDYRAVHHEEVEYYRRLKEREQQGTTKGSIFYQSDRKLHEDEVKQRLKREFETGVSG